MLDVVDVASTSRRVVVQLVLTLLLVSENVCFSSFLKHPLVILDVSMLEIDLSMSLLVVVVCISNYVRYPRDKVSLTELVVAIRL